MNLKKLKQIGISHSRMTTYRSGCKKRFWYTMEGWINPSSSRAKNTLFGNLCHNISEHSESTEIADLVKLCNKYVLQNQNKLSSIDPQELEHEKALASITMHCYYNLQKSYKDYVVLKNELYLKRLKIGKHVFNIKIDKVLQHKKTKELWIMDHKCKSRFDAGVLAKKIIIDQQLQLYRKGFETAYKRKVSGVIWDIIRKPGLRMTKKDTDMTAFMNRVKKDIENRPEWYFVSLPLRLRPEYCENFDKNLDQEMESLYRDLKQGESAFTINTDVCDSPYLCEFLDGCSCGNMNLYIKK